MILKLNDKLKESLIKKQYGIYHHSAVQVCEWNKKALRGEGTCYKQKFYNVNCEKCVQMTPLSMWCNSNCIFCWRPMEFMKPREVEMNEIDLPKPIIRNLIKERIKLLNGFKGNDKVNKDFLKAAQFKPNHFAISLSGEPTLYPHLPEMVDYLVNEYKAKTVFIVSNGLNPEIIERMYNENKLPTQLYISCPGSNKKMFLKTNNTLLNDAWEKYNKTLNLVNKCSKKTRTVLRMTMIKNLNMDEKYLKEYKENIIDILNPDFIEVKGYIPIGMARKRLDPTHMPSHDEIKEYSNKLLKILSENYKFENEQIESTICLLKRTTNEKNSNVEEVETIGIEF